MFARPGTPTTILIPAFIFSMLCAPAIGVDWGGQGEVGFVMARGNSDSETGNIKLDLTGNGSTSWKHSFQTNALYGRSNEVTAAERWSARWQTEYKLDSHPFIYGAYRYEQDHFSGFVYQSIASTGVGYNFLDTQRVKLSVSLGAGYRELQPQQLIRDETGNVIQRIEGEPEEDLVGNAGLNYEHHLTESTTLINKLLVETGTRNTFAQNELALQVAMTKKLALGLGYSLRHNAEPPPPLQKTDQLTTMNLVYKLK